MIANSFPEPQLPLSRFRFVFHYTPPLRLPRYAGSAWRGALGQHLKKTVCVVRDTPCPQCLLRFACAYAYVFETPPPPHSTKMRKYNAAPHPFVLSLAEQPQTPGLYWLDVVLIGHGARYLPYLIHALHQAGQHGIGGQRQMFTLQHVEQWPPAGSPVIVYQKGQLAALAPPEIPRYPAMPQTVRWRFETPLRLKQDGRHGNPERIAFGGVFSNLLRRVSMLTYFHTDTPLETDFAALTRLARGSEFRDADWRWYEWQRYSSRQDTTMHMGGVIGTATLPLAGLEALWSYLWLGQWIHAGKATSMGLGMYRLETVE